MLRWQSVTGEIALTVQRSHTCDRRCLRELSVDAASDGPLQRGPLSDTTTAHATSEGKISALRDGNKEPIALPQPWTPT